MKKIFLTLFCIFLIVSISGCGKTLDTPQSGESNTEETTIEYVEPEIEEIEEVTEVEDEPEEDIEEVTEVEEEPKEEIEEIEGIVNSPETPCGAEDPEEEIEVSYVPDVESYFNGDSFNLEEYLYDCGAESVEITPEGCIAIFYEWEINLHSRYYSEIPEFSIKNQLNGKAYYFDPAGDPNIGNFYSVDDNNTLICEASIRTLPELLNAFYSNGFAYEPPVVYGLITNY